MPEPQALSALFAASMGGGGVVAWRSFTITRGRASGSRRAEGGGGAGSSAKRTVEGGAGPGGASIVRSVSSRKSAESAKSIGIEISWLR